MSNQCVNTRTTDTLIKLLTYFFYLLVYFLPNELNDKPAFSKHYCTSRTLFENLCFPKTPLTRGQRAKTKKNKSHFSRISGYVWTGPELGLRVIRMLMMLPHLVLLLSSVLINTQTLRDTTGTSSSMTIFGNSGLKSPAWNHVHLLEGTTA